MVAQSLSFKSVQYMHPVLTTGAAPHEMAPHTDIRREVEKYVHPKCSHTSCVYSTFTLCAPDLFRHERAMVDSFHVIALELATVDPSSPENYRLANQEQEKLLQRADSIHSALNEHSGIGYDLLIRHFERALDDHQAAIDGLKGFPEAQPRSPGKLPLLQP